MMGPVRAGFTEARTSQQLSRWFHWRFFVIIRPGYTPKGVDTVNKVTWRLPNPPDYTPFLNGSSATLAVMEFTVQSYAFTSYRPHISTHRCSARLYEPPIQDRRLTTPLLQFGLPQGPVGITIHRVIDRSSHKIICYPLWSTSTFSGDSQVASSSQTAALATVYICQTIPGSQVSES